MEKGRRTLVKQSQSRNLVVYCKNPLNWNGINALTRNETLTPAISVPKRPRPKNFLRSGDVSQVHHTFLRKFVRDGWLSIVILINCFIVNHRRPATPDTVPDPTPHLGCRVHVGASPSRACSATSAARRRTRGPAALASRGSG